MTVKPVGERVARLETLAEEQSKDMRELLDQVRGIASALRSITQDAAADSRRLGEVDEKVDALDRLVKSIARREDERGAFMKAGAVICGLLVSIGGFALTAWSWRHSIAEVVRRNF